MDAAAAAAKLAAVFSSRRRVIPETAVPGIKGGALSMECQSVDQLTLDRNSHILIEAKLNLVNADGYLLNFSAV